MLQKLFSGLIAALVLTSAEACVVRGRRGRGRAVETRSGVATTTTVVVSPASPRPAYAAPAPP
ncbi:MAG: hypothetical protein JNK72_22250 [Myxococcales bacterium]|nr:hypothetical protein [Myxococcales bacterium]